MPEGISNDRPVVLIVGPTPPPIGGISAQVELLLNSSLNREFELAQFDPEAPLVQAGERAPLLKRLFVSARMAFRFLFRLVSAPVALVHLHASSFPGVYEKALLALIAKAMRRKVIFQLHGGGFEQAYRQSRAKWLIRFCLRLPDRLVAVSEGLTREIRVALPDALVEVVPNSITTEPYQPRLPRESGPLRILFVGWMIREKGIFDLLDATARLAHRLPPFEVHMVGDGRAMGEFHQAVSERGMGGIFQIHGWQEGEDKCRFFRSADIFALPSHVEAFGIVLLEAMAAGLPIVATRVGGIPEIVVDGVQGDLVPPHDAEALAQALEKLCSDPELRARYGAAGLQKARAEYDVESGVALVAAIYHQVLSDANA